MRACCGLRVVLHGECGDVHALQAFDHVVVQIDVGDEHLAVLAVFKRRVDLLADRASTAKPWLWAVTSTLPVVRSLTGWLMPRWPNLSL